MSLLLVLVVLAALMIGSSSVLRSTEGAVAVVANTTFKESAVHAGELGIARAFQGVQALASEEAGIASWYFATTQPVDAAGMPTTANWGSAPSATLGNYTVQWVAERLCTGVLPVTDVHAQCQVSETPQIASAKAGSPTFQNPPIKYFRITARIVGPRGTEQFVQSLVSR